MNYYQQLIDEVMKKSPIHRTAKRCEDLLFGAALLLKLVGFEPLRQIVEEHPDYQSFSKAVKEKKFLSNADFNLIFNAILVGADLRNNALDVVALMYSLSINDEATQTVLLNGSYHDYSRYNEDNGSMVDELAIHILQQNRLAPSGSFFECCSAQGNVLAMAGAAGLAETYCGQDSSAESNKIADIRLRALHMQGDIYCGDILTEPKFTKTNKLFDLIYGNVPFVSPKKNVFNKGSVLPLTAKTSYVWDFIDVILKHLKPTGRAVVMVQTGSLFKHTDRQIRETLIEDGRIESIISLPKGLLPYSPLRVSLVVLSSGNQQVHMVDAEQLFTIKRRFVDAKKWNADTLYHLYQTKGQNQHVANVDIAAIRGKQYKLLPASYMAGTELVFENGQPLHAVCQVIRGKGFKGKELDELHDDTSSYGYINSANVDIIVSLANSTRIRIDDPTLYTKYEILPGDIVLTSRSTTIKAGTPELAAGEHLIASPNVVILRPDTQRINPTYLMMLLLSQTGHKLLDSIQSGTRIITITPRALENMVIPVPPLDKQVRMAEAFQGQMKHIIMLKSELVEANRKMDHLFEDLDAEVQ